MPARLRFGLGDAVLIIADGLITGDRQHLLARGAEVHRLIARNVRTRCPAT